MNKKILTLIMMLVLSVCFVNSADVNAATKMNLKKVQLSFTKATMQKGSTLQLRVYNGAIKSCKSSNKKVVAVNKTGKLTAKKNGKAKITVTATNGKKYTCSIQVKKHKHQFKKSGISIKTKKVKVKDAWDETKKVKVKDAWDEQVYVCTHFMQLDTGEYLDTNEAVKAFCQAHNCVSHSREALARYNEDPSVGPGLCGCRRTGVDEYKTVHHDAEYKTKTIHHDAEYKTVTTPAQTHTVSHLAEYRTVKKCSECGAVK